MGTCFQNQTMLTKNYLQNIKVKKITLLEVKRITNSLHGVADF